MKNIKLYADESAYVADSTNRTSVAGHVASHVTSTNSSHYDGKNLLLPLKAAEIGDAIVFDCTDSMIKVLRHGTINKSSLPTTIILGSVVVDIEGATKYGIGLKWLANKKWAEAHKYFLTGFDLINGGTVTLTFTGVYVKGDKTITYDAGTTLDAILALFKTSVTSYCYICGGGIVIPLSDYGKTTCVLTSSSPALTLSEILPDWQATSLDTIFTQLGETDYVGKIEENGLLRLSGSTSYVASICPSLFKSYFTGNGSTGTNYSEANTWPLKEASFNTTDNPTLVAKYGDYDTYLKSFKVDTITGRSQMKNRDYKTPNDILAAHTYPDPDGTVYPVFPAVYSMRNYGIATDGYTTGFEQGNWFAPTVWLLYKLYSNIKDDMTDVINETLRALAVDVINPKASVPWSCQVYDSNSALDYYSANGALGINNRDNTYRCRPFVAFQTT